MKKEKHKKKKEKEEKEKVINKQIAFMYLLGVRPVCKKFLIDENKIESYTGNKNPYPHKDVGSGKIADER